VLPSNDAVVILDTNVTQALADEGTARDLVRLVQQARRKMNLDVSDRIALAVASSAKIRAAVEPHTDYIREQTLATELSFRDAGAPPGELPEFVELADLDGAQISISLRQLSAAPS
jgi:isoleucyl-tRNA synthetase